MPDARNNKGPRKGPLHGIRILELQAQGPCPFAAMLLSDLGADVVRVDRVGDVAGIASASGDIDAMVREVLARGRRSIAIDLKSQEGSSLFLRLVGSFDVVMEGFRPGVMERLGLGPAACLQRNPRLVFARATGWGQSGPSSSAAGHDINYVGLSGALWLVGRAGEAPVPPLAYVGDFGGGGMLMALGICAALLERAQSGRGQVIDAAMVDGAALLSATIHALWAKGMWVEERGANLIDSGAPFYDTYETADGQWVAVGAIEPKFYENLLELLGLDDPVEAQLDRTQWPGLREKISAAILTRTREQWCEAAAGVDACLTPVLAPWEAYSHPHHIAREAFLKIGGVMQPAPAPRFDRTPGEVSAPAPSPGEDTDAILQELGVHPHEISALRSRNAIA